MLRVRQLIKVLEMEKYFGPRQPCRPPMDHNPLRDHPVPPSPLETKADEAQVKMKIESFEDPATGELLFRVTDPDKPVQYGPIDYRNL